MKKILSFLVLAGILLASSCSLKEDFKGNESEFAQVSFTIGGPNASATRAIGDGTSVDMLHYAIYDADDVLIRELGKAVDGVTFPTQVEITLAKGQTYKIAFWAQNSTCGAYSIENGDVRHVAISYDGYNNDENRDAFFKTIEHTVTGDIALDVTLERPFAQINLGVTEEDWNDAALAGINVSQSKVSFSEAATGLDLFNGSVSGKAEVNYLLTNIPSESLYVDLEKDGEKEAYRYLSLSYILVNADDKALVDAVFTLDTNKEDVEVKVDNLPVQRNWRTNVIGRMLTGDITFNIDIDPIFDGEENYPDNEEEALHFAALNGGEMTLTTDVELDAPLAIEANTIIDLGGHTLTGVVTVAKGAQATISNGKIINTDKSASGITSNGDLTLNNVDIESARHALRIESGNVVVNGGTYKVVPVSKSTLYALNVGDGASSVANVVIKGGTFIGPKGTMADSGGALTVKVGSTVKIEGGDFSGGKTKTLSNNGTLIISGGSFDQDPKNYVADGYKAILDGGKYYVVENDIDAIITNIDQFESVLADDSNSEIFLVKGEYTFPSNKFKAGKTLICEEGTVFTGNSKLNIKGSKVVNATFSNPSGTAVDQTINGVFEDCVFTGTNALRYCYAGEKVEFINCVFDGSTYGIHFDGGAREVKLIGCTISGFNAFAQAITSLSLENCTFKATGRSGYNGANLWCGATMTNCEFAFDNSVANEWIDCIKADGDYQFNNCTINGVNYTSSNYDSIDKIFSRNNAKVYINGEECQL